MSVVISWLCLCTLFASIASPSPTNPDDEIFQPTYLRHGKGISTHQLRSGIQEEFRHFQLRTGKDCHDIISISRETNTRYNCAVPRTDDDNDHRGSRLTFSVQTAQMRPQMPMVIFFNKSAEIYNFALSKNNTDRWDSRLTSSVQTAKTLEKAFYAAGNQVAAAILSLFQCLSRVAAQA